MKTNPDLHAKLAAFQIDQGTPRLTFAHRLARENDWPQDFAQRVLREYFRFLYLVCISKTPVTPSVAVDQAWHLHLCYTRSYWDDLCRNVLAQPLHHGPTEGGAREDTRYRRQYEHTLSLYQTEFGQPPPPDIWPAADLRFSVRTNPFWVSRDRFIVLEKTKAQKTILLAGLALAGLLGTGAVTSTWDGIAIGIAVIALIGILIWWLLKHGKGGPGSGNGGCGTGCSSHSGHSGCGGDSGCGGSSGCGGGGCGSD